jgi:hypothetical protein
MSTVPQRKKHQLRVSSYDKVSSWIVALLVITCVTVGALFIIYITSHFILGDFAVPVTPISTGGGGTGGVGGTPGDGEVDTPGAEDATAFDEPQIQDTLSALATAVSSRTAILADEQLDIGAQPTEGRGDNRTPGFGGGRGGGVGGGIGSGFGPGRGGPAEPRREIRFEPSNLQEYAQWLDFFKIELGVLGQDNKVYYAYNLSHEKPDTRVGDPAKEIRLFMNPTDSQFAALDRQLVAKAGIGDKGRIILQFYPPEAQGILISLEQKRAGTRKPETIRGTVFRVTHTGNRFEFSVEDQTYRY